MGWLVASISFPLYLIKNHYEELLLIQFNLISYILVIRLRSLDTVKSTQAKFLIHTMQIIPQKYCKTFDTQKILPVLPENDTVHYFRVEVKIFKMFSFQ